VIALATGFITGLSLIVAIGAQNAFVIRQGLMRSHVFTVVLFCALSDTALIFAGVGGLGALIQSAPHLLEIIRWFGVIYLLWFSLRTAKSAFANKSLTPADVSQLSLRRVIGSLFAFTYLNPHVYLDTVIFLGSVSNQFSTEKWIFAFGASTASVVWFSVIGFGARSASQLMSKPIFWKVFDICVSAIMAAVAILLATASL
jgi:L-lysine exporter family protein LysE/ArgO